jgi:hypothetical protein
MKKLLVAVALLSLTVTARAGDYHKKETLRCSQCHTMHASRQHQLNGAAADTEYPLADQNVPHRKLLIQNGTNETCLACHDGKAAIPDVLGANASAAAFSTTNARSAGALNGAVASHTPGTATDAQTTPYADWMGHTLGTDVAPPGFVGIYEPTPVENFNCANCHAVHGSGAYRNLGLSPYMGLEGMPFGYGLGNPFELAGPTYNPKAFNAARAVTTFDATRDVSILSADRSYQTKQVVFGAGSPVVGGMNAYCAVCHGNFHGDANTRDLVSGTAFVRHPTTGITRLGADNSLLSGFAGTAETDVVRPAWAQAPATTSDFQVACLTCHKGHGNARGYGLVYPGNTGTVADFEQGDAAPVDLGDGAQYPLRNLCITCHPMGRF